MQKEVKIGNDLQPVPHKFEWTLNAAGANISHIINNEQNHNNSSIDSVNNVL